MIVTLEEAREYLRIDEDDTSNDDVIQSSLETAQALCLDISRCEEADAEENHGSHFFVVCKIHGLHVPLFYMSTGRKRTTQAF